MKDTQWNRRDFNRLTVAAFGGLVAGTVIGCGGGDKPAETGGGGGGGGGSTGAETGGGAEAAKDVDSALLLEEPHVCRGLNTCKGKGKGEANECAGQGACATAEAHECATLNACKGQGGCGEHPGQNACKGKGKCGVPMTMKDKWQKARDKFVELMKEKGKEVGDPPSES